MNFSTAYVIPAAVLAGALVPIQAGANAALGAIWAIPCGPPWCHWRSALSRPWW